MEATGRQRPLDWAGESMLRHCRPHWEASSGCDASSCCCSYSGCCCCDAGGCAGRGRWASQRAKERLENRKDTELLKVLNVSGCAATHPGRRKEERTLRAPSLVACPRRNWAKTERTAGSGRARSGSLVVASSAASPRSCRGSFAGRGRAPSGSHSCPWGCGTSFSVSTGTGPGVAMELGSVD